MHEGGGCIQINLACLISRLRPTHNTNSKTQTKVTLSNTTTINLDNLLPKDKTYITYA